MCGILGSFNTNINLESLMLLSHRGPDDNGFYKDEDIYLGQTRLSIQDLSPNGHQPMISDNKDIILVYNGEIYNHKELRKEIESTGYNFKGSSDTEVVLKLYEIFNNDFLLKINGIFAIAIWDVREKKLLLARDHFGVKPLYYTSNEIDFTFSSELKSIIHSQKINKDIDYKSMVAHLTYMWSPSPRTMFKNIKKLEPGHAMIVKDSKIINHWKYFDIKFNDIDKNISEADAILKTKFLIKEAVKKQLISDVPVGAFLSGGLDSTSIVAFAKDLYLPNKLETYTIDFENTQRSSMGISEDISYAKKAAEYLDVKLNILKVNPIMISDVRSMIYHLDEPQADPAAINTMLISQYARKNNIKVLLSGAGGDDIFTGYRRHLAFNNEKYWSWLPQSFKKIISNNINLMSPSNEFKRRLIKLFQYSSLDNNERIASYFYWINPEIINTILDDSIKNNILDYNVSSQLIKTLDNMSGTNDKLNQMLYLEIKHFLCDHNLNYTDKMGMSAGVEIRVPLLDKDLVDFTTSLPVNMKQRGTTGKWIFKKAMEGILPNDLIYRPKAGFGVPLRHWMKTNLKEFVNDTLSSESLKNRMIFSENGLERLRKLDQKNKIDASYTLFSIVCIETWYQLFVDNDQLLKI
jgi:asparagine synthase (glutamine-hydrolysing)